MNKLCTICARGGSKGVKNKNIRTLHGKPLIAHSLIQAIESKQFDAIAVSSDSEDILRIAKEYGAHLLIERPSEMATDQAAKLPVIQHCVREAELRNKTTYDIVVDLDATSPLRHPQDIVNAIELLLQEGTSNVITGALSRRSPYFNMVEQNAQGYVALSKKPQAGVFRRQDAPPSYDMNASIYAWHRDSLLSQSVLFQDQTRIYVMPEERSLDIDSELDFKMVEFLLEQRMLEL